MPALWITASERPSLLTSSATVLGPAMVERSPETTPPAPAAAARASRLRPSFRPCNTTSWPWSIRSRAAMRPRPSDDPVMNTQATLTPPVMPSYRLTNPNALPAPRVFPFTLCAARRRGAVFMAAINFVRISSNDAYRRGDPWPSRLISRVRQAATWDPATANDLLRLELLVTLTVWRRVSHRALQCGQRACAAQSPRRHGSGEHRCMRR